MIRRMLHAAFAATAWMAVMTASPLSASGVRIDPEDSGLAIAVLGIMEESDPDRFAHSVLAAIPEELLDRRRNFTGHPAYVPGRDYALVLAFHDPAQPVEADLCRAGSHRADGLPPPPDFRGLDRSVGLTGALCMEEQTLRTSTSRSAGRVTPEQVSFRFLVADVVKALFPDGFARLPRTARSAP